MADKNTPDDVLTDENGETTTPLCEAMADALEDAIADPFKKEPKRGLAGEAIDEPTPQPHGGTTTTGAGDDGDNSADSGNDVDISCAGDNPDERIKIVPVVPGNVFAEYASTASAREAAELFAPKTFVSNGTSEPDNRSPQSGARLTTLAPDFNATTDVQDAGDGRVVSGASGTLDARQEQATYNAMYDRLAAHPVGADLSAEIAAHDAVIAPLLAVRAPMPVTRALDPLARTPTPR